MNEVFSLNKLVIDKVKKNDLKQIFEILMILPTNRTIADLNTLSKIMLNIEPIKQIKNLSAIYHCCKFMYLAKFKEKDFIFQKKQESESLYIVLNGKIGLYKRSSEDYESEEVIFLDEGSCFGKLFSWKIKIVPLALEETLVAILPKREFNKIGIVVNIERELILKEIKNVGLTSIDVPEESFRSVSNNFIINRVPHGHYLIKKGETPKVIFLILKGMVKKVVEVEQQDKDNSISGDLRSTQLKRQSSLYTCLHYSTGDYFPKSNTSVPVNYDLITECPSEIVTLPKKVLKSIGYKFQVDPTEMKRDAEYYNNELQKQADWANFKQGVVEKYVKRK